MKHTLTILATLASASLLATGAQANTSDWGTHDTLEVAASITPVGDFEDSFLFKLANASNVFSTAVSNNLTGVLGLSNGVVSLYRELGSVDEAVGSFAFNDVTGSISHSFGALLGGDYYYLVTGSGTGTLGGFYTLSSTVSAVPEGKTLALLLAGLGVVGFVAKRRRPL